jgi:hypothetical protein
MRNSTLYWWVLVVCWAIAIGGIAGLIDVRFIALVPFLIVGFAFRCLIRQEWRENIGNYRKDWRRFR